MQRSLKDRIIQLKQNLHRSCQSANLHLAPKPASHASDTIHDAADIPEVLLEFFLERLLFSAEEYTLIKFAHTITDRDDIGKFGLEDLVFCYSASDRIGGRGTDIIGRKVGSDT